MFILVLYAAITVVKTDRNNIVPFLAQFPFGKCN